MGFISKLTVLGLLLGLLSSSLPTTNLRRNQAYSPKMPRALALPLSSSVSVKQVLLWTSASSVRWGIWRHRASKPPSSYKVLWTFSWGGGRCTQSPGPGASHCPYRRTHQGTSQTHNCGDGCLLFWCNTCSLLLIITVLRSFRQESVFIINSNKELGVCLSAPLPALIIYFPTCSSTTYLPTCTNTYTHHSPRLLKNNASLIFNVILEVVGHQECEDDQTGERALLMCYSLCFDSELKCCCPVLIG